MNSLAHGARVIWFPRSHRSKVHLDVFKTLKMEESSPPLVISASAPLCGRHAPPAALSPHSDASVLKA